jgi:hypothetical protein
MATGHEFCVVRVADFDEAWVSDLRGLEGEKPRGSALFCTHPRARLRPRL